jgi:adenylate cyclase
MDHDTSLEDWLARSGHTVGIVFADIVGSTLLLHRLKTRNFALILGAYQTRASQLAAQYNGRLIDRIGDQLLAAFENATTAYEFGSALFDDPGHPKLTVRVGVHIGKVRAHDGHLVGRHIHFGARVVEHGRGNELWVSDAAKIALERESSGLASRISWITVEECELPGIPGPCRLWRAA